MAPRSNSKSTPATTPQTSLMPGSDGTRIFVRYWPVEKPSGQVLLSHGHGEHGGRYEHVARRLNAQGWDVIAPDHRGHGRSEGIRGHTPAWSAYVEDLHAAGQKFGRPELPRVLLGHSMGGLIAISYALRYGESLRALLLSGPLLQLGMPVPPLKAIVGRVFSRVVPWLSLSTGLDAKGVSRDPEVVAAYLADRLVHDKASTRWFTEMLDAMENAHGEASRLQMPVLLFHGEADPIVAIEGARRFFSRLETADRHFKAWPGLFHEIFNEPEKDQVLDELIAWTRPYLAAKV